MVNYRVLIEYDDNETGWRRLSLQAFPSLRFHLKQEVEKSNSVGATQPVDHSAKGIDYLVPEAAELVDEIKFRWLTATTK